MAFITFSILYSVFSLLLVIGIASAKKQDGLLYLAALSQIVAIIWGTAAIFVPSIAESFLFFVCGLNLMSIVFHVIPPIKVGNLFIRIAIMIYVVILLLS